jgi:xylose isomerase
MTINGGILMRDLRNQAKVRTGDDLVKHLKEFSLEPKFSAGVWFFAPAGGRFHDRYVPEMPIEKRLEIAGELVEYGLQSLEAHYPAEINEDNLPLYQELEKSTGIRVITVVPGLFYDAEFEFGSLSSPIPEVRKMAIERTITTLKMNQELGTDFAIVWPGIDGFESALGIDFYAMWHRFEDGLASAMDAAPGVRIAIEPKPYEPRGNNIYRNTADGLIMEKRIQSEENKKFLAEGHAMVTLNPEVGHVLMGFEDLAYSFSRILRQGRLAHTHWNSQPLGNYDQDLNVGLISPEQALAAMYALKMHGYNEFLGIDINPERMPVKQALINNMDRLKALIQMTDEMDHELVVACIDKPDKNRGILEAYMTRVSHPNATGLSKMPQYVK